MKLVIAGGSGQRGTMVARACHAQSHDVVVLSRRRQTFPWRSVRWDGVHLSDWVNELDGSDVVINLAGRSVNCRYTAANRRDILHSRVLSTRAIGRAIAESRRPPALWLQTSTATIYSHRYDAPNDERSGIIGGFELDAPASWTFSVDVARQWEAAVDQVALRSTRKVVLRTAMTMSPDRGGVF